MKQTMTREQFLEAAKDRLNGQGGYQITEVTEAQTYGDTISDRTPITTFHTDIRNDNDERLRVFVHIDERDDYAPMMPILDLFVSNVKDSIFEALRKPA